MSKAIFHRRNPVCSDTLRQLMNNITTSYRRVVGGRFRYDPWQKCVSNSPNCHAVATWLQLYRPNPKKGGLGVMSRPNLVGTWVVYLLAYGHGASD